MAEIKITFYKKLPPSLQSRVKLFDRECFPWIYETESRLREHRDKFSPSIKDRIGYVCAMENNKLSGMIIVMRRNIVFEKFPIILGGIACVCVCPEKRKQGLATKLLTEAINELKRVGCDIAYLCTDVEDAGYLKLYGSFGFKVLGRPQTFLGKSGKRYIANDAMIAPINSKEIFERVITGKEDLDIGTGNW